MIKTDTKKAGAIFSSNRNLLIIMCVIIILGAILRLYGLTWQSIWLDEANGIRIAEKGFTEIVSELKSDVSPPLHYFMLHIWMKIFGNGELSTRAFASIFGILLIPAIYYIGSKLFSQRTGLISAFIVSTAQFHIRYSQEVRMYSMMALVGLLSMYFLYRAMSTDTKTSWAGYTLCTVMVLYTHNYGIFITASGVMFIFIYSITRKIKHTKCLIALCVIALSYLPWIPILITKHYGSLAIAGWIPYMSPEHIIETFKIYCGLNFNVFKPITNNLIIWAGLILFLCYFLAGIFSIRKYKNLFIPYIQNNAGLILLLCYLVVTLAIPMLVSIKKPIYLSYRYSIAAWPAFVLLSGHGLAKLKNQYSLMIVLISILFLSSVSLYWHNYIWEKSHDDRSIAGFIESRASEGDLMVFLPTVIEVPIDYYLRIPLKHLGYPWKSSRESTQYGQAENFPRKPNVMVSKTKSKLLGSRGKIFLIYKKSMTWVDKMDEVKKLFDKNFTRMECKKYEDVEVTIYKYRPSEAVFEFKLFS